MDNNEICAILIIKEADSCTMLDAVKTYYPGSSEDYINNRYNELIKAIPLRRRMWVQQNINIKELARGWRKHGKEAEDKSN
jgi:hypothetical protein